MARSGSSTSSHPAELYKSFVKFYYEHVATEEYGLSWKLSEMMRQHGRRRITLAPFEGASLYPSAREQGLTDEMVEAIPNFRESALFTPCGESGPSVSRRNGRRSQAGALRRDLRGVAKIL